MCMIKTFVCVDVYFLSGVPEKCVMLVGMQDTIKFNKLTNGNWANLFLYYIGT